MANDQDLDFINPKKQKNEVTFKKWLDLKYFKVTYAIACYVYINTLIYISVKLIEV